MPRGIRNVKEGDEFVVVTSDQDVWFFRTKEKLLSFLNETGEYSQEDEDERRNWTVLPKFPIPSHEGDFCPMGLAEWRSDCVVVMKNGTVIDVQKNTITKQVVSYEYTFSPAPVVAAKRRGRPRSKKSTK
jgi:hypothetical protein